MAKYLPAILGTTLILTVGFALFSPVTRQPSIVEYDMNETVARFHESIGQSELTDDQRAQEIARFSQTLDDVVREYATNNHVVVFVSPAIVSGAVNATQEIEQLLLQALQAQNDAKRAQLNETTQK
ncbi:TrbI F-type domain-containing protein [Shewanella cutis]|uniref:TrbI F-type domain-containing protein n=1 Tax=Shewanella cutis TaxID=2766780 RepID=A0ABS9R0F6_9GAMM|nr:TrbI F-type domain-containing protein [Shewanella sp. PS-2]MCG9966039.1 TrbI F-type domain-containing protein [Shewanella sp. PS-2]